MKTLARLVVVALFVVTTAILVWPGLVAARSVAAVAQSQNAETNGIVRGIITHINDARIVGASLQFASDRVRLETETDQAGSYEIKLQPDFYDIQVKANGFQRIHKEKFEVRPGEALALNIKLFAVAFIDPIAMESALPEPTEPRTATIISDSS
jgi:hypothetical protein